MNSTFHQIKLKIISMKSEKNINLLGSMLQNWLGQNFTPNQYNQSQGWFQEKNLENFFKKAFKKRIQSFRVHHTKSTNWSDQGEQDLFIFFKKTIRFLRKTLKESLFFKFKKRLLFDRKQKISKWSNLNCNNDEPFLSKNDVIGCRGRSSISEWFEFD